MKRFILINIVLIFISCSIVHREEIEDIPSAIKKEEVKKETKEEIRESKPIVAAVLDTGFGYNNNGKNTQLCKFGHKDFTNDKTTTDIVETNSPIPYDNHSHGTHIAGLINTYAKGSNYCLVILKCLSVKEEGNLERCIEAIKYAINIKVDIINYSGGGTTTSQQEIDIVKKFLDGGGIFVAASGNERSNLNQKPYYPAMDDERVIVVGSKGIDGKISGFSNYGPQVDRWEIGENVEEFGYSMSGTSQATAVATGKIIKELDRKRKMN